MASPNKNIIQSLRGSYDPHFKLENRVEGLEKNIPTKFSNLHTTLSKSFALQRKTLMRVLGLEKKLSELERQKIGQEEVVEEVGNEEGEEEIPQELDSVLDDIREEQEIGGDDQSGTLTAVKPKPKRLRVKKKKIRGSDLKKGSSQESLQNIEERVNINEKKISLLKGVVDLRKQNIDKRLDETSPLTQSLESIASTADSIRETLIEQQAVDKRIAEKTRKKEEAESRAKKEKDLEKPKFLEKMTDKVMQPVMSIWGRIWKFISTLFLGKILFKFLDWFGNPANQGKIKSIVKFIGDWWPALTAAVLLFGTGFGGLVVGLGASIAWFIPVMTAALAKLRSAKFMSALSSIPGGGKVGMALKGAALLGGGMFIGSKLGSEPPTTEIPGLNEGGIVPSPSGNKDIVPAMGIGQDMTGGGRVSGKRGKDEVPAMLTHGESVLKVGAREKMMNTLGVDPLAFNVGPNANKPKMVDGKLNANTGGLVTVKPGTINSYQDAIDAGIQVEDTVAGNMRYGSIQWLEKQPKGWFGKQKYIRRGDTWHISGTGGGADKELAMSTEDYVNMEMGWSKASSPSKEASITGDPGEKTPSQLDGGDNITSSGSSGILGPISSNTADMVNAEAYTSPQKNKKPDGLWRGLTGMADFMTLGMWDFDQRNPEGSPKDWGPMRMVGGMADFLTFGLTDFDKRGAGVFQFNPIGGGDNKKWEIRPKELENSVISFDQLNAANTNEAGAGDGNEIPSFDARPNFMIDDAKMDILGMMA